jgi:hypothetical protein
MSPLNPYASHLGNRQPQEVIAATPARLEELIKGLGPRAEKSPAPGKWSPREIACHLADCEIAFGFRLRQTLAEDGHVVQPFDQEKWARQYAGCDVAGALAAFSALRRWNVTLITGLRPADLQRKVTHPERGEMTLETIVQTMAGHDLNHLKQIEAMTSRSAGA